jgi:hypothetical protein
MGRRWRLIGYFPILYYPARSPTQNRVRFVSAAWGDWKRSRWVVDDHLWYDTLC